MGTLMPTTASYPIDNSAAQSVPWVRIGAEVLSALSGSALRVYLVLRSFKGRRTLMTGVAQEDISTRSGLSLSTVERGLRECLDKGVLEVVETARRGDVRRSYRFIDGPEGFAKVPNDMIPGLLEITPGQLRVYLLMKKYDEHWTWVRTSTLAEVMGTSHGTVRNAVSALIKAGLVSREGRGYRLTPVNLMTKNVTEMTGVGGSGNVTEMTGYRSKKTREPTTHTRRPRTTRTPSVRGGEPSEEVPSVGMDDELPAVGGDLWASAPADKGKPMDAVRYYEGRLFEVAPRVPVTLQDRKTLSRYLRTQLLDNGWTLEQVIAFIDRYFDSGRALDLMHNTAHHVAFMRWAKKNHASASAAPEPVERPVMDPEEIARQLAELEAEDEKRWERYR